MDISDYSFRRGLRDGIPIALGYLSVAFSFGILASAGGLPAAASVLISLTNLTSAGQLAGVGVIFALGSLSEMALTQLVINIRYALMSVSLSQKADSTLTLPHRLLCSFFITDEIFAVASARSGLVGRRYLYGLALLPYLGWSGGTAVGALAGHVLPADMVAALGIAMYAMFIAIVLPQAIPSAPGHRGVILCVLIAAAISCILKLIPFFSFISGGFVIIICALAGSAAAAVLFPVRPADESEASN